MSMLNRVPRPADLPPVADADDEPTIPISHLALDLDEPGGGWVAGLTAAGIPIHDDDLGRRCIAWSDARQLLAARRDALARHQADMARLDAGFAELQAQRVGGGFEVPEGVSAIAWMTRHEKGAQPQRTSVLHDALAGGQMTYHPIRDQEQES